MPPTITPFSTELLTAIRANAYLDRELDLSSQQLTLENVVALTEALVANTTLTTLDVNFNKIGEDLRKALALLPDQNKKRLANMASLATVIASFRANPESEINTSLLPLLPLIHTWAGLKTPTVQMEKVISATFFKNLVRDSAKAVKDKEKKEEKLATAAVSHSKGDAKGNANKRKREDSNESTEEVKPSFKEARIAESLAASMPRSNAGDLSAHSSRASSNSSSSASSSTSPSSATSAPTEIKPPALFRAG